jgi:phage terminase small subunit
VLTLLRWQWQGYPRFHAHRGNLLLHIVAVPAFQLGAVALVAGAVGLSPLRAILGAAAMGLSVVTQGRGHRLEQNPPEPFTSPFQAVGRILLEQFVNFPRFVLSGGWWRALQAA